MHESGFTVRRLRWGEIPGEMLRIGRESIRFGWDMPRARVAILAAAVPAIFLEWSYHAWQPYFLQLLGKNLVWVTGVIAAATALATMCGNWIVERLTRFCGRRTTILLFAAVVYTLTNVGVGLTHAFWAAVLLYLVGMMSTGVAQPVRQGYLHLVVASEQRATVLSLASLVASLASMVGQAGIGYLSQHASLATGYVVGGAVTILAVPLIFSLRRLGGGPDQIVGKAGRYSTCASLALPEGVAVAASRDVA
jgi:MFS family permease